MLLVTSCQHEENQSAIGQIGAGIRLLRESGTRFGLQPSQSYHCDGHGGAKPKEEQAMNTVGELGCQ